MPHICHIVTTFNIRSGSALRTIKILKGCIEKGYRVSLIIGRDYDVVEKDIPGVDIYVVPQLVKYISPKLDLIVGWKVRSILKRIRPDLVHTHLAKAGIVGRLAAKSVRIPYILHTVHGPSFPAHFPPLKRWLFRTLEKVCGLVTNQFVFVGQELKESYITAGIHSASSGVVIHTGRPDIVFDRHRIEGDRKAALRLELCEGKNNTFLMVTVGRIVPSKQLDHSIRIVHTLQQQGLSCGLAIVGKCLLKEEQQCEENLRLLAVELGVQDRVHFPGFRKDILDVMDVADVVILTSSYEGLPNVAVEAMIAGTPMVTYQVSGVSELFLADADGFVVPQGDMNGLIDKIKEIYLQPISSWKEAHENPVLIDFRESVMVSSKMDLYEQIFVQERESK